LRDKAKLTIAAIAGCGAVLAIRAYEKRHEISFKNKSVVITGGSRGLGLLIAREMAAEGARLTLLARDSDELRRASDDLASYGTEVLTLVCDVANKDEITNSINRIVDHYGQIDVLINNAGIIQAGPLEHMSLDDFQEAMAVHFWGPLHAMWAAIPFMRKQRSGRIVNISSIGGKIAIPHLAPYCASKFALTGVSDAFHAELAKDDIFVTTVCPGLMRTGSHLNALFKGQHMAEFTWFALLDGLPLASIDGQRAARQIVNACRKGKAHLTITTQARIATILNSTFPNLMADIFALTNRMLPSSVEGQGKAAKTGWDSRTKLAPSLLTSLIDSAAKENNETAGRQAI